MSKIGILTASMLAMTGGHGSTGLYRISRPKAKEFDKWNLEQRLEMFNRRLAMHNQSRANNKKNKEFDIEGYKITHLNYKRAYGTVMGMLRTYGLIEAI